MKLRNRILRGGGASYCKQCRHYHRAGEEHRCSACHKKIWSEEQWALDALAEEADAQFDAGEFSGPAHGRYLEKFICLCDAQAQEVA